MAHAKHEEQNNGEQDRRSHFLVAAYGIQSHLNPARALARRLARIDGCNATLLVPAFVYHHMFSSHHESFEDIMNDGVISYIPFSDGKDDESWPKHSEERMQRREATFKSLSAIINQFTSSGQPITCIVCTLSMPVVFKVAREHRVPLAVYWIQPATTLATYYHYFHGYNELILPHISEPTYEVSFPGLHSVKIRNMPSLLTENKPTEVSKIIMRALQELFQYMDQERPIVLVNTFAALEDVALNAIRPYMDVFAIGPAIPPLGAPQVSEAQIHLFKQDEKDYIEWLNIQAEKSVVYLSFGSLLTYTKRQVEEISYGLQESGWPCLWVVRKEGCAEEVDLFLKELEESNGMVVEWCDQLQVLSHPSIGCFVTHCGWNSTIEAIVAGVPMIAVPSWSDQPLNAYLVETEWRVGVRAERDAEGILTKKELVSCVELLMGGSEKATKIKENANNLKKEAQDVVGTSGLSEISLRGFIKKCQQI